MSLFIPLACFAVVLVIVSNIVFIRRIHQHKRITAKTLHIIRILNLLILLPVIVASLTIYKSEKTLSNYKNKAFRLQDSVLTKNEEARTLLERIADLQDSLGATIKRGHDTRKALISKLEYVQLQINPIKALALSQFPFADDDNEALTMLANYISEQCLNKDVKSGFVPLESNIKDTIILRLKQLHYRIHDTAMVIDILYFGNSIFTRLFARQLAHLFYESGYNVGKLHSTCECSFDCAPITVSGNSRNAVAITDLSAVLNILITSGCDTALDASRVLSRIEILIKGVPVFSDDGTVQLY